MKIFFSQNFEKDIIPFPIRVKRIYKKQEEIFALNWKDPRLHIKKLINTDLFSFRITRKYRVLFKLMGDDSVIFLSIGHRRDIYD